MYVKKTLVLCVFGILILNGCATSITTRGQLPYASSPTTHCPARGAVTINAFRWADLYLEKKQISLERWLALESNVKEAIEKTGCFSSVEVASLPVEEIKFDSDESARTFLTQTRARFSTKYIFEVYSYHEMHGYHGNGLMLPYIVWYAVHIASVGLIPVWMPANAVLKAKVWSTDGKMISDVEVRNSASLWMWSPFIFSSKAKKYRESTEKSEFLQNTVNTIIQRTNFTTSSAQK